MPSWPWDALSSRTNGGGAGYGVGKSGGAGIGLGKSGGGGGWVRLGIEVVEVDSGRNNVIKAFERGLRMEIWVEPCQTRMFC